MAEVSAEEAQQESRPTAEEIIPDDVGFECEFADKPPRRSQCPICLMVPRNPQQTPCCGNAFCGNAFCKACISKVKEAWRNPAWQPCPTCKTRNFSYFPDKGLQQELYSSKVYCTNRSHGCDWEGELRELELHLIKNPDNGKKIEACKFQLAKCCYCQNAYLCRDVTEHQNKECGKRPFTCPTCREYESTYDDVMATHQSICKCRPVDCPNKCGQAVQHQKLEEHLSSECELSEVECEFSHAGCEAKMLRTDLLSHMTDNVVGHMFLLAKENRMLKNKVAALDIDNKNLVAESKSLADRSCLIPLICIKYPWSDYINHTGVPKYSVKSKEKWLSILASRGPLYNYAYGIQIYVSFASNSSIATQTNPASRFLLISNHRRALFRILSVELSTVLVKNLNQLLYHGAALT